MILALDAGHGMSTAGKRCLKSLDTDETRENWLNRRIAEKVINLLTFYKGIEIVTTYDITGETDVSLKERCTKANNAKADLFLSIHHNAGANGTNASGITVYTCTGTNHTFQQRLYSKLIEKTGLKGNRSSWDLKDDFSVIKYTNMPACLMELGFMDSSVDVPIILTDAYASQCAEAIVEFVAEEYSLQKIETKNYTVTIKCGENQNLANSIAGMFSGLGVVASVN